MVKGRRTRQANSAGQMLAVAEAGAATDDTASPKRKDFKYDNNASHFTTTNNSKPATVPTEPMVLRGGRTKVNGIAKYLTSCNGTKPVTAVVASSAPKLDNFIDLTDENTCDSFDNNTATNSTVNSGESPLAAIGFNVIKSNPASNIFLQEPVLTLNFDKTPSDKSRVIIKNSFLTTEIHNKFSPPKCEPVWGDVTGATASNTIKQETPDFALDLSKPTQVTEIDSTTFLNQDSNSCDSGDSGVVILPSGTLEVIGTGGTVSGVVEGYSTRRKPATPHRILCPSPVKLPIVASPSTALAHMNIQNKRVARKNTKSKRRLHTKELENTLEETVADCTVGALPLSVAAMVPVADAASIKQELDKAKTQKPVLNDSVNPTAQQNTSNNQSSKPPSSSTEEPATVASGITVGAANKTRTATTGESGGTNKKLTDFFQVRRSVRKTKKEVQWERDRDIEKAIREQREAGLKVANFEGKGRGIITTRPFAKGEFVVEYIGDLITVAEAKNREQIYAEDDNTGCYMYYFKHQNVQHCIDATAESGKLGRLVNHSRNGNLMTKTVSLNGRPHLVLIAKEDIAEGVEITYDYGDRSKEALQHHPWLAF